MNTKSFFSVNVLLIYFLLILNENNCKNELRLAS
jgi:hypothetical protein